MGQCCNPSGWTRKRAGIQPNGERSAYARTDVDGAYRSEDAGEHWIPLNDCFEWEDATYLGIEGIVLGPQDGHKL
jgi:hypothetical protein